MWKASAAHTSLCKVPTPTGIRTLSLHDALPISNWLAGTVPVSCDAGSVPSRLLALTAAIDRKSTRLNSSHVEISYAVFCLKKKNQRQVRQGPPLGLFIPDSPSYRAPHRESQPLP